MARMALAKPKRAVPTKRITPLRPSTKGTRSTLHYLDSLVNFEKTPLLHAGSKEFGIARTARLLAALGNPHRKFKTVHIAGTKGKGSTCAMVAAMLRGTGLKTGLYSSPHILNVRERILVNAVMIAESAFGRVVAAVEAISKKAKVAQPTYFEVLTAAAFLHFAEEEVDIAVVETGMGGRLDATNVLTPEIVGITSISVDHMAQLGSTLVAIAGEKAGIIKKGVPVVSAPQRPNVREVLEAKATEMKAPLHFADEGVDFSYRFEHSRVVGRHARICLTTPTSKFEHVHVPLLGEHQAANCTLALRILDLLKSRGVTIDDQAAVAGLGTVKLPGRMQMICDNPRILVDGAHNAASIDALMRAIGQNITYDSMIVIFGCQKDKDIPGMIRRLQVGADKMIFTNTGSPRTADPTELSALYMESSAGKMAQVAQTLEDAMTIATSAVTREDLICITGSFYLVAEALRKYCKKPL